MRDLFKTPIYIAYIVIVVIVSIGALILFICQYLKLEYMYLSRHKDYEEYKAKFKLIWFE